MCGIFGHCVYGVPRTKREVVAILLGGLRRLEYRGYDSSGICIDTEAAASSTFDTLKTVGNVAALGAVVDDALDGDEAVYRAHAGIAHTRWATHGRPCTENAHPQTSSERDEFVVVHNGVITNHEDIKSFLATKGLGPEDFASDTDTEVIPKLLKMLYDESGDRISFPQLVADAMSHIDGAYAVLVKSRHFPGELVATRRGSPLVLGAVEREDGGAFECFVSSDPGAIVEHSPRVTTLENGDIAHVSPAGLEIFNARADSAAGNVLTIAERMGELLDLCVVDVSKGVYSTFMEKEIREQPSSLAQTTAGRVPVDATESRVTLGGLSEKNAASILSSRRIVLVACGTSYNAALCTRQIVERMSGLPVNLELASDFVDRRPVVFRDDTFVFVSQSGETADTLAALDHARAGGAVCVGVTNVAGSTLSRCTDFGVHVNAGPEIGVASTKAFTSQITALVMLALALAGDRESLADERRAVLAGLRGLPEACAETLLLDGQMRRIAERIVDEPSLLAIGRGADYATALEGGLKIKEVALMHSEGILAGELKHGPLALVSDVMPIVAVVSRGENHAKMLSVVEQLVARDCSKNLIVVCETGDRSMDQFATRGVELVRVPSAGHACLGPILYVIPFQLLSLHLATVRGHDVDRPRNLAKSVTVSD